MTKEKFNFLDKLYTLQKLGTMDKKESMKQEPYKRLPKSINNIKKLMDLKIRFEEN